MHKTLIVAAVALACSSCSPMCQEFHADQGDSPSQTFKLGAGYEATLIIGSGVGPL